MTVLYVFFQLKILLDQVDDAVGDFDECILLRPDSALAQAQKCFALVSNLLQWMWKSSSPSYLVTFTSNWKLADEFILLFLFSTDKRILETTLHKYRRPWMDLRMLSGGSLNVLKAMLFMLRYGITNKSFLFTNDKLCCTSVTKLRLSFSVNFRLWLISSILEKQMRCMTSVLNWNQIMLPHMSTRGRDLFFHLK